MVMMNVVVTTNVGRKFVFLLVLSLVFRGNWWEKVSWEIVSLIPQFARFMVGMAVDGRAGALVRSANRSHIVNISHTSHTTTLPQLYPTVSGSTP